MIKIFFISNYSELYGANRSLLTLLQYFHSNNYSLQVLLPSKGTMEKKLKEIGIPYIILPYYSSFLYMKPTLKHLIVPILALLNLLTFPFILSKIKKFNPDLIYSNTSAENIGVLFAKILGIKHISHIREFMSLDHNSYFIFGKELKRRYIKMSDGVIFVSNSVKNEIITNTENFTRHIVIYNGISSPVANIIEKELPVSPSFGLVGLLDPGKGQYTAVSYFSSILAVFPESKLHIFGDKKGKYKKQIERLIESLNIKGSVIFHGFVEDQNKIYEEFDILLMFSRSEGFGRVTVEAMLRGKPVIGYNNAGTAELIEHQTTGCLFENIKTFKDSVEYIMISRTNYNKIRFNAFSHIRQLCDEKDYCLNVERFINQTINSKK